jgi:hypothetical protein
MKTKNLLASMILLIISVSAWSTLVEIGSHGGGGADNCPFDSQYGYYRSANLYLASEIGTTGLIGDVYWENAAFDSDVVMPCKIYLKTTSATTVPITTWSNMVSGATLVFDQTVNFAGLGWKDFVTSTFNYTSGNLLVLTEANYGSEGYNTPPFFRYHTANGMIENWGADNTPPLGNGWSYPIRPDIRFEFIDANPPTAAFNPIPANAAVNVFPGSNLFWSATEGMARTLGYKLYLGTNNPPTNMVNGTNLGKVLTYDPPADFAYVQNYYWKIVPFNRNGDATSCPVWHFTTSADMTISTLPWNYGFEPSILPDAGWTHTILQGSTGFELAASTTWPLATPHGGNKMLIYNCGNKPSGDNAILTTPAVHMTDSQYTCLASLWIYRTWDMSGSDDRIELYVNSTQSLSGATQIGTLYRSSSYEPQVTVSGWHQYTFDMGAGSSTNKVLILKGISGNGCSIDIDDLVISKGYIGAPPNPAINPSPATLAHGTDNYLDLLWSPADTGAATTGYKLWFGRENPPSSMIDGLDLGNLAQYSIGELEWGVKYYWKVVPYNVAGSATGCPVWSFSTRVQFDDSPGNCLFFDGYDDYVSVPNDPALNLANNLTIEAWVMPNSLSNRMAIYSTRYANAAGSFQIEIGPGSGGTNRVAVSSPSGWVAQTGDNAVALNVWNHIVYTRSGPGAGTHRICVNGEEKTLITNSAINFTDNTDPKMIGGTNSGYTLDGMIDELRIWDDSRTVTEIREGMYVSQIGDKAVMKSYWQFSEGSGLNTGDCIAYLNGDLVNMDESAWQTSTVQFGYGYANTQTETDGLVSFSSCNLDADYTSHNSASVTVSLIYDDPNIYPSSPAMSTDDCYWVMHRYGTGGFSANLTFWCDGLMPYNGVDPSSVKLYTRPFGSDGEWIFLTSASYVDFEGDSATFNNISTTGQFILARMPATSISTPGNVSIITNSDEDTIIEVRWDNVFTAASYIILGSPTIDGEYYDVSDDGYFGDYQEGKKADRTGTHYTEYWYAYPEDLPQPAMFFKVVADTEWQEEGGYGK